MYETIKSNKLENVILAWYPKYSGVCTLRQLNYFVNEDVAIEMDIEQIKQLNELTTKMLMIHENKNEKAEENIENIEIKPIIREYAVYQKGELKFILNSESNAKLIKNILEVDSERKIVYSAEVKE